MENKLTSYSKTINDEEVFFLKYLNDEAINLSSKIYIEICEVVTIFNDDLVFLSESEEEFIGIYSFNKQKVIFPFIIREFYTSDKSGFIFLTLEDESMYKWDESQYDMNPHNDFVYLHTDGSIFQNEGKIYQKIGKYHFMLEDGPSDGYYKLYSNLFDTDDSIGYRGISNYEYVEEENLLVMNMKNEAFIYDILQSTLPVKISLSPGNELEYINANFFSFSIGKNSKFKKIINRKGETICCYTISRSYNFSAGIKEQSKGDVTVISYEFNFFNEFYCCNDYGFHLYKEYITIDATNLLTYKNVTILISMTGELKFFEIDLQELNILFDNYIQLHESKIMDKLEGIIAAAIKSGIKIQMFDFINAISFSDLPKISESLLNEINDIRERMVRVTYLDKKQIPNLDPSNLVDKIVHTIKHKFNDGTYFKMNNEGIIQHLYPNFDSIH